MGKPLYIALLRLLRLLGQKIVHFDKALKCKNKGVFPYPMNIVLLWFFLFTYVFNSLNLKMYIVQIKLKVSAKIIHTHFKKCWIPKGQLISKANCQAEDSSKKRTNEFIFTSMRRVFVRFLGESSARKKSFWDYLTFSDIGNDYPVALKRTRRWTLLISLWLWQEK